MDGNSRVAVEESHSSKMTITFVQNYKQIVSVDQHRALLPLWPRVPARGAQPFIGETPVHSILFKNLNNCFTNPNDDYQPVQVNLLPLRNFLLGRKKGKYKEDSAFKIVPKIDNKFKITYILHPNRELLVKFLIKTKNPLIVAKLKILGVKTNVLPTSPEGNGAEGRNQDKWTLYQHKRKAVPVHELLSSEGMELNISPVLDPDYLKEGITMEQLVQQPRGSNLDFIWTIWVLFDNAPHVVELPLKTDGDTVLKSIYELGESTKDLTIVASNKAEIKCHKNILMAQSPPICSMLIPENQSLEYQSGRIELLENSADGLEQFVKFMYGFEIEKESLNPDIAVELLQLANKYGVKKLEAVLVDFLVSKSIDWFNVDAIMELYFWVRNVESLEELKAHALIEMSGLTKETLSGCEYFKKLPQDDAMLLIFTLLEWK